MPKQNFPTDVNRPASIDGLRVSAYDQVSGMLIALLMLIGAFVFGMFLIWASGLVWPAAPVASQILNEPEPGGGGAGNPEETLEEPKDEEIIEVIETPVEVSLEAITDVVKTEVLTIDKLQPKQHGTGGGSGGGDGRGVGSGIGDGVDIIPRWERWDIKYEAKSIETYSAQLDAFGVELGAVGGGQKNIDYAASFSGSGAKKRSGDPKEDKRLYFTWRSGELQEADQMLLARAGVNTSGRIIMQFYPADVENRLAIIEKEYAGNRDIRSIKRTQFGVRGSGGKYEFFVLNQTYRTFTP